ncbi:MAG: NTP transferase domain-containing protein [Actinobacteria bacterium]|nr:NTP transferase domain-containing protein [Actinomycetota bacterium]MBU1493971.1 NTP transferase domain-containing protein [Actinomycetota bacterium]
MKLRQAVLLVGGRGTRVWPLTAHTPKALLPVAGIPFIEYQIRLVAAAGVEEVLLAVGQDHLDAWRGYVDAWEGTPALSLAVEEEPLDTAGGLVEALDRLDDRFLVLNGDVVLEADLAAFIGEAPQEAGGTIALVEVEDPSTYGVVVTDESHMVEAFVEKPPPGTEPARTVNAGIYVLQRRVLEEYQRGRLSFERVVFPTLTRRGDLGGILVSGTWLDIGTQQLLVDTNGFVMRGQSSLHRPAGPHGGSGGIRKGSWSWVAGGAVVHEGATIEEGMVMEGAEVADGVVVRGAVVGPGARIGAGALIAGASLVGPGATIGAGCEIDSGMRVAPDAVLPPGSVTFRPPR